MKHWFTDVASFQRDQLGLFLDKARESNEPVVRLRLGLRRIWLATDPDFVRVLLKGDERIVDKGFFIRKLRPIVGNSVLTINGDENQRRRKALHTVLAKGTAKTYAAEMGATVREAAVQLAGTESFDALEVTAALTLRMICVAMFGKDVLTRSDEALVIAAVRQFEVDLATEVFRALPPTPWASRKIAERRQAARTMMNAVVSRVRKTASDSSILRALLDLGLCDEEIRDEIVTMLIAGHHTTGAASAWILYYLATVPGLADNLADEARRLSNADGELTSDALAQATVSQLAVKEILRLYPSAHWFSRDAREDIAIGNNVINSGDSIIICPWQLHRDERFWSRPNEFDLRRSFSSKAYIPYGGGPRACIGMALANMNLQLIALELASAYSFECADHGGKVRPLGSVTLIPPAIRLVPKLRLDRPNVIAAE